MFLTILLDKAKLTDVTVVFVDNLLINYVRKAVLRRKTQEVDPAV